MNSDSDLLSSYGPEERSHIVRLAIFLHEQGREFWSNFEKHYCADKSAEERALFETNKYFLASLRLIYSVTFLTHLRSDLEHWIKDILLPKIMATRRAA